MGRRVAWLAIGALLPFSGCLGPESAGDLQPHGFLATFTTDGGGLAATLELAGPAAILDRDGVLRRAYQLRETLPDLTIVHHLDRSFHEVRTDHCRNPCQAYLSRSWERQGALPPYHVGLPLAIEDGMVASLETRERVEHEVDVEREGSTTRIRFGGGTHDFDNGRLLPSEVGGLRLASYERFGPLEEADLWPKELPSALPSGQRPFPGAEQDDFGLGLTHKGFYDALAAPSSPARAILDDGGCIVDYDLRLHGEADDALLPGTTYEAGFDVLDASDRLHQFVVRIHRSFWNEQTAEVEPVGEPTQLQHSCGDYGRSPWPDRNVDEFLRAVGAVGYGPADMASFQVSTGTIWAVVDRVPEMGLHTMVAWIVPPGAQGSFQAYYVSWDPHTGWYERVLSDASDFP